MTENPLEVFFDLTYVDVNNKWHYICLLIEYIFHIEKL